MGQYFLGTLSDIIMALAVVGSGLWFIFNWRKNKRKEEAITKKAEAEAFRLESENKQIYNKNLEDTNSEWQRLYQTQNERIDDLEKKMNNMEIKHQEEIRELKSQIEKLKSERRVLYRVIDKAYRCPIIKKIEECVVINEVEKLPRKEERSLFSEEIAG